jgi:hypothetical protein
VKRVTAIGGIFFEVELWQPLEGSEIAASSLLLLP